MYDPENEAFISHQNDVDFSKKVECSFKWIVENDVKKSIKEKQKKSTYIAWLNKDCFPDLDLEAREKPIKPYSWDAKGPKEDTHDNCSTALNNLITGKKKRTKMNPVQSLSLIIRTGMSNLEFSLTEQDEVLSILADVGLTRTLYEISKDEENARNVLKKDLIDLDDEQTQNFKF